MPRVGYDPEELEEVRKLRVLAENGVKGECMVTIDPGVLNDFLDRYEKLLGKEENKGG